MLHGQICLGLLHQMIICQVCMSRRRQAPHTTVHHPSACTKSQIAALPHTGFMERLKMICLTVSESVYMQTAEAWKKVNSFMEYLRV
jgi:hypothetical protein